MSQAELDSYMAETERLAKLSNDQFLASQRKPPVHTPKPCTVADPAKDAGKVEAPSEMKPQLKSSRLDEFTTFDNAVKKSPVPVVKASPLFAFDNQAALPAFGQPLSPFGFAVPHISPLMAVNGALEATPAPTDTGTATTAEPFQFDLGDVKF
jgi:hypothetical protein